MFGTPQTITLTRGELALTDSATTTISGPAANLLTINGNNSSRVFNVSGSASISGLTVTGGSSSEGGGILNSSSGNLSLTNVLVSGSHATAGGGISNRGTATLNNVTISGNSAVVGGGMISFGNAGLTNATVSGNSASTFGGGLYNYMGSMTLRSVTVSGNSAGRSNGGGGVLNYGGTTSVDYTIIAGNSGGDVSGAIRGTYNLIGTGGSGGLTNGLNGNIVLSGSQTPGLAPLGNYGGQTPTMALLPGSPALRACSAVGLDQRGVSRGSSMSDIGAFQSRGFTVTITGGNNQTAQINTAFASPLLVQVASPYGEPVAGGVVIFSAPGPVTMATFTGNPATIDTQGNAGVGATASGMLGGYYVYASTNAGQAQFRLTNSLQPAASQVRPASAGAHDAAIAQLGAAGEAVSPGNSSGHVPAGDADRGIGPANDAAVVSNPLRPTVRPAMTSTTSPVNARLKYASDASHPDALGVWSGRDRFSFADSKDLIRAKPLGQLN